MNQETRILSIRENPDIIETAIRYFQEKWPDINSRIYEDSISNSINAQDALPQWYLLEKNGEIIGCAGLVSNDFISRMDLYPWLAAVFIDEAHRGNAYPKLLIDKAKKDTRQAGYKYLYLCTEHVGYYERYGFTYIGDGYHPWGESSRIYQTSV